MVNERGETSVGAVQLVSYWLPDFWSKPRGLTTAGLAEMVEKGAACFETHRLFWCKGHLICRSVSLGRANLGLK